MEASSEAERYGEGRIGITENIAEGIEVDLFNDGAGGVGHCS